jgi:Tfp pilus assembly protein PilO
MVLSPKRDEASKLSEEVTQLETEIDQQKQAAAFAEDARRHFPAYYGRLVVMGKAVPADADTASLLVELNSISNRTGVSFDGVVLAAGESQAASAPAATPPSGSTGTSTTTTATPAATGGTTTPAPATEATAASLPLGAAVGPAGLPTMPYELTFSGTYFDVADFINGVDDLVHLRGTDQIAADGRLLTIDGFSLKLPPGYDPSDPTLEVKLSVTSYVTPADQGLTAGATPGGPAPAIGQSQAQPASATVAP